MTTLWIRADGSEQLGLGHVMRSLALADVATECSVPTRCVTARDAVAQRAVARRGYELHVLANANDDSWLAAVDAGDVVVFDGYHFTERHHRAASACGAVVAAIADAGHGEFAVDVLVDQNAPVGDGYHVPPGAAVLTGPRYALLRREFTALIEVGVQRPVTVPPTLLLTFGGTDAARLREPVLRLLGPDPRFRGVRLLQGPGTPARAPAPAWLDVVRDPRDVAGVFADTDAAVSAAGSTTWELLGLGVATALVVVAPNQRVVAHTAVQAEAAIGLGGPDDLEHTLPGALAKLADPAVRTRLSQSATALVDGRGAQRVLDVLLGKAAAAVQ